MKRQYSLSLLLFSLIFIQAGAQTPATAPNGPVMHFDSTSYNYGDVKEGEVIQHKFAFTNTGNAPLEIVTIKPSCNCTNPIWTAKTYQPGEKGEVILEYKTQGKMGQQHSSLTIINNTEEKVQSLEMDIHVVPATVAPPTDGQNNPPIQLNIKSPFGMD